MIAPKGGSAVAKTTATVAKQKPQDRMMSILQGPEFKARIMHLLTEKSMLDRYIGVLIGVLKSNEKLAMCTEASIVGAMLKSAFLNLEPNNPITQQCWLIPRFNGKTQCWECSWEIGVKGLIQLAYRSDQVKRIRGAVIHQRDIFDLDIGGGNIIHRLPQTDQFNRGPAVGYWGAWSDSANPNQGPNDVRLMSMEQMQAHVEQYVTSNKGEGAKYSPWTTAWDEMALKTVIKKALKSAPISVEDFVHGIKDDGMPVTDEKFQIPNLKSSLPQGRQEYDLMTASEDLFTETIEVESSQPEPQPVTQPEREPPKVESEGDANEELRLKRLGEVMERILASKLEPTQLIEKLGMPKSMVQKASLQELDRMYKALGPK